MHLEPRSKTFKRLDRLTDQFALGELSMDARDRYICYVLIEQSCNVGANGDDSHAMVETAAIHDSVLRGLRQSDMVKYEAITMAVRSLFEEADDDTVAPYVLVDATLEMLNTMDSDMMWSRDDIIRAIRTSEEQEGEFVWNHNRGVIEMQ